MSHHVVFGAGFIATIAYLGLLLRLVTHLRRAHPDVWVALGRPEVPDPAEHARNPLPFAESAFRTVLFIFSNRYKELEDRQLTYLIWLVRMTLAASVVFFVADISLGR